MSQTLFYKNTKRCISGKGCFSQTALLSHGAKFHLSKLHVSQICGLTFKVYHWFIQSLNYSYLAIRVFFPLYIVFQQNVWLLRLSVSDVGMTKTRADCDAPCFEQLKATHLRASPKQQALLDVLLQLIKTWPLTIGPWTKTLWVVYFLYILVLLWFCYRATVRVLFS